MKNKKKLELFEILVYIATFLVVMFMFLIVLTICIKGIPYIKDALFTKEVKFSVILSIRSTSISTLLCIALAIPTCYAFTKLEFPLKKISQILIELPLCLPYLVLGLSLLIIFSSPGGKFLKSIGIKVVYSQLGIIVAQTTVNLPYTIRFIKTAFSEVDTRLEFISQTLGASKFKTFLNVTIPLSKNSIIGALILTWSRGMGEFGATLMLAGVTRMKTETLPASIYLNVSTGDMGVAMASALILFIISSIALFISTYFSNKNYTKNRLNTENDVC
ncbi:MAG: ABC transporter permease [Intestinibacter sp.]